jgi:hypothetical protein
VTEPERPAGEIEVKKPWTQVDSAVEAIRENKRGMLEKAANWWKLNRIERVPIREIVEHEHADGARTSPAFINCYILAYEKLIPELQPVLERSVAAEVYVNEADRIRAKQKEIDDWQPNDDPSKGPLKAPMPPHSRFQAWCMCESMLLQAIGKFLQARGIELLDSSPDDNLLHLPEAVRKQLYEAMHRAKKTKLTKTTVTQEVTLEDGERTDAGPTPGIIEADPAPER